MEITKIKLGNPQEEAPPRRVKKISLRKKIILFSAAAVTIVILLLALLPGSTAFDGLHRFFAYMRVDKDGFGCAELYQYTGEKNCCFASVEDSLIMASVGQVQVLDEKGKVLYTTGLKFHQAAISHSQSRAAVYDIGGSEIYVVDAEGLVYQFTCDGTILTAHLNEKGWLAVTVNKSGCKAAVYVYDPDGEMTFEFDSSERFVMTASVSGGGEEMAAVTMGQEKGSFVSNVVLYKLNSDQPYASCDLQDDAVYQLGILKDDYCAVAENALNFVGKNGKLNGTYDFSGEFLRRCSFSGEDYAALLLGTYKSGSQGRLVTVNAKGAELASVPIGSEVLSLSACGNYVATLCSDHLTIYNRKLKEVATLEDVSSAREILMRQDGSVILAGSEKASLYLP